MKLLILLLPMLVLADLKFTKHDLERITPYQQMVLDLSYLVGEEKGVGLDIAAIAIVETTLGKFNKPNHICGPHQIDYRYTKYSCQQIEDNPVLSAKLATKNFLSWKYGRTKSGKIFKRSVSKQHRMYNVGYLNDPFQWTHWKKIRQAKQLLRKHYLRR